MSAEQPHDPKADERAETARAIAARFAEQSGAVWQPLVLPLGWEVRLAGFEDA